MNDEIKRVLVTGGAGYIGSILVRKLLERGYKVNVLDRFIFGIEPLKDLINNTNLYVINGDVRHIEDLVKATKNVDAVIHLAAIVGDEACKIDEDVTLQINLESTKLLLEICKYQNIKRVLFASTCSVYGFSDEIVTEDSKNLNPVSLYSKTKLNSEKIILENENMTTTVLRLSTVHGLSPRMRFDLVINILTAKACIDKEIQIFGGGQWRPFIHVEDVTRAFVACLEAEKDIVDKQIFNIGSNNQNFQIRDLGDKIKKLIPDIKIKTFGEDTDKRNYRVNFDKINRVLNFKLTKTIEDSIKEMQKAIEKNVIINYKDDKYYNGLYKNYKNPNLYFQLLDQGGLF